MLRSLVGSEMCIRDSINAEYGEFSLHWGIAVLRGRCAAMGNAKTKHKASPAPAPSQYPADPNAVPAHIMTSRRSRAETLGKMITRDKKVFCEEPRDVTGYQLWCSHFPLDAVLRKSDELLCSDMDLAYMYKMVVPAMATSEQFWSRYYYAQTRVHEDEQILEAREPAPQPAKLGEATKATEQQPQQLSPSSKAAAACGRVNLSPRSTLDATRQAQEDAQRCSRHVCFHTSSFCSFAGFWNRSRSQGQQPKVLWHYI
eukprot:TRINITY_DN27437_c0_g1_i3.p2 TRINITY_DN27437_c0_g1~~TRINITY_DN27437_c0_g1_i3.p2  ORF type:complete len:272 (+),score=71.95 TRINITY_DN27437_c0_g1_i3:46-816(+)